MPPRPLCLVVFAISTGCVSAAGKRLIFPHMKNNGDTEFGNNCDDCYREADIQYKYRFYGNDYTRIFVSSFLNPYNLMFGWTGRFEDSTKLALFQFF